MSTLERAITIAVEAHRGQTDRADQPYILHPMRLMLGMEGDEAAMIVAILHDVVEDTAWTLEQLAAEGFDATVVAAIDRLSRRDGERYEAFIERIAPDPLARRVKLADLKDNMDVRRLPKFGAKDCERMERYHRAWRVLSELR